MTAVAPASTVHPFTITAASTALNISAVTLRRWCRKKYIPALHVSGTTWLIEPDIVSGLKAGTIRPRLRHRHRRPERGAEAALGAVADNATLGEHDSTSNSPAQIADVTAADQQSVRCEHSDTGITPNGAIALVIDPVASAAAAAFRREIVERMKSVMNPPTPTALTVVAHP